MIRVLLALLLAGCATTRYQSFDDVDYGYDGSKNIWGKRSQVSIHVASIDGPNDAVPLILIHPWAFNMMVWRDIAPELAKSRRVVLINLPGHGKSGKVPGSYPMRRLAAAVLDVMDALEIPRAVIGGNSLGGATSLATALEAPERVAALILVAAPGGRAHPGLLLNFVDAWSVPTNLESLSAEAWGLGLAAVLGDSPTAVRLREDMVGLHQSKEWSQWCRTTSGILASVARYEPAVEKIEVPTLVVHAENDFVVWRTQNEGFIERMKRAELVEMKSCSHMPEVECPDQLLPAMVKFLSAIR